MTLPTALQESCDTWFYRLGYLVYSHDPQAQGTLIQDWASKLGLGKAPVSDLPGATSGYLPRPGSYFQKRFGFPWTEGQTINLAIGQGALQVSPLQLAVAYSALINGGKVVRPHVGEAVIRDGVKHALHFKPVRKLQPLPVHLGDQAGPLRSGEQPRRHLVPGLRGLPEQGRGQDGNRRARIRPAPGTRRGRRTTARSSSWSRMSSTAASEFRRRRRSRRRSTPRTSTSRASPFAHRAGLLRTFSTSTMRPWRRRRHSPGRRSRPS